MPEKLLIDGIEYFQQLNELDELGGCDTIGHDDFMTCKDCIYEIDGECKAPRV